jgi:hypothetical protein
VAARGNISTRPAIQGVVSTDTELEPPDLDGLYRAERDRLRRLAYLMTGRLDVAEEVAHDAFVRIQPRLDRIDSPARTCGRRPRRARVVLAAVASTRPAGWEVSPG